jgi:hypothetical protein
MRNVTFDDLIETMELIPWTEGFDMSTVPDQVLRSEWARRNARKRKNYTGGRTGPSITRTPTSAAA